jgi:acyl phosphate:glycerol-3-phosphate acyltransferase
MVGSPSNIQLIISTLLAYLIGGLPFGYLFVRFSLGKDVRTMGSGNIGATNVHRTAGGKAGVIVLLLDILKGFVAIWLAAVISDSSPLALAWAAAAVMVGHCYPIFLGFKGGKAVACFIGAFLYLAPIPLLITILIFVIVVAVSKYISLGSIIGAALFPLVMWLVQHPPRVLLYAAIFSAILIVYRHKANIGRLLRGRENVFSVKSRTA